MAMHAAQPVDGAAQLAPGVPAHRDVVLLHRRGRDRIDRRRNGQPLQFARRSRPGCTGRSCARSRRRPRGPGTAAGHASGCASSIRSVRRSAMPATSATEMARKSSTAATGAPWKLPLDSTRPSGSTTGLSMELASSRSAIERGVLDGVPGGAVHRGRAAQRVGVLHPGVLGAGVRGDDRRPGQGRGDPGRADRLTGLRAQRLQLGGEHPVGAQQRLHRHRRRQIGRVQQHSRSASASTSMPSMPSVPLIRARPSFSAASPGSARPRPAPAAAGRRRPRGSITSPSPISASATVASGARSPEQPSDPYSGTIGGDAGVEHRGQRGRGLRADAGAPRARVASRSSISARTTSRSTGCAAAGRMRADQRGLQRGSAVRPGWTWWPARRSRSRCRSAGARHRPGCRRSAGVGHRSQRRRGQRNRRGVPCDGDDLLERQGIGADGYRRRRRSAGGGRGRSGLVDRHVSTVGSSMVRSSLLTAPLDAVRIAGARGRAAVVSGIPDM